MKRNFTGWSLLVLLVLALSGCGGGTAGVQPTVVAAATNVAPTLAPLQPTVAAAATSLAPTVAAMQPTAVAALSAVAPTVVAMQPTAVAALSAVAPTINAVQPTIVAGATSLAGMTPDQVVQSFYQMYTQLAAGGNPLTNPQFETQAIAFFTPAAISKVLTPAPGHDPILCAQNVPQSFTVDPAVVSGNSATATVHLQYGSSTSAVSVQLVRTQDNGAWLINDITCM